MAKSKKMLFGPVHLHKIIFWKFLFDHTQVELLLSGKYLNRPLILSWPNWITSYWFYLVYQIDGKLMSVKYKEYSKFHDKPKVPVSNIFPGFVLDLCPYIVNVKHLFPVTTFVFILPHKQKFKFNSTQTQIPQLPRIFQR